MMRLPLSCDSPQNCLMKITYHGDCNSVMISTWFSDLQTLGVDVPSIPAPKEQKYLVQGWLSISHLTAFKSNLWFSQAPGKNL